jgi:SSS family solute:Na+ symporter
MIQGIEALVASNPEKLNVIGDSDSSIPFSTLFTGMMLVQLFYWGTNQAIIQRALAAKNLEEGQKGLIYAGFVKILGPIIVVLPGIIAFHIFGNELDVANGDQSYGLLVAKVLPKYLVGFFAAVLFGAILSSFNSALNSSVTLFGLDIYKEYIKKDATEKEVVKAGKSFGIVLALFSMLIAPSIANAPSGLFGYLQEVNGCYSIPILTIIIVGYMTKKVPASAAKIAMLSGVLLYCFSQFYLKGEVEAAGGTYPHYLHVMAILFSFNVLLMLVIGYFKPRSEAFELKYTEQVDITPWKLVKPMGILISVIVILIYIAFS